MPRTALPVDRNLFEKAVQEAEANGPLSKQSELFTVVADKYNATATNKISPAVVKLRIEGWQIPIKTAKARVFTKGGEKPAKTEKSVVPEPTVPVPSNPGVSVEIQRRRLASGSCGCGHLSIIAPAGHCPVKLTGTDRETVLKWAEKVVEAGHKIARHYTMKAVKYYAREFFDCYDEPEKLRTVLAHLESIQDTTLSLPEDDIDDNVDDLENEEEVEVEKPVNPTQTGKDEDDFSDLEEED